MPRLVMREVTAKEIGKDQAEMLGALVEGLQQKGIKEEMIEAIAVKIAGAGSCFGDGCGGMENPAEVLRNPVLNR
ncbi:MAG: hypothetical protein ACL93V_09765 [Candidatus Electrothrix sp. YB6]